MATSAVDRGTVGILGGMFDPVHFGHLRIALDMLEALNLAQVRLLPCGQPAHRGPTHATAEQRLRMLALAIADEPRLTIDRREIDRAGPSYMVDTLASLRTELGEQRPLCLILGMDAFAGLDGWHQWRHLVELAHLVVVQRPGQALALPAVVEELLTRCRCQTAQALQQQPAGRIWVQSASQLEISSTAIREMIASQGNPRYLLPDAVLALIRQYHLYQDR